MALFHFSTNSPPKPELLTQWIKTQPWGPSRDAAVDVVGSFHLDDPEGQVGMQVYVVEAAGVLMQVPLTYRDAPLAGADEFLVGTVEHSALGTRYVYDGLGDERFVAVFAGVTASGYGQALGFAEQEGRWYALPDLLRVQVVGTAQDVVPVDGFVIESNAGGEVVLANDHLELTVYRAVTPDRIVPDCALTVTWPEQSRPVTLAELRKRQAR